ncbi:hypothetical protein ISF_10026 [Cordyceps fumosorosea ARSEF 2679]|uniref:BED-type domain-containing protein n=1 Tax=Cordyceps fumosorosea (strain ARSEF 2679) TaxID=1081104 RepID=A0A166VXA7_CORFA|nr:hypothetical protein ISF_10026 [Cordyceps fumosorosea ARSEF 2679]OAA34130.1 hypothetical protein ISF_10026 [Cordyceps fumosorosea ARSEF 2679]
MSYPSSTEHLECQALSSLSPESSISAVGQPYTQTSVVTSSVSSPSTYESQPKTPKKRKLRTPETWKHFRLPQADEETHQSSQRLWYCQKCCNPSWRTVSTTSAKRHMRNTHAVPGSGIHACGAEEPGDCDSQRGIYTEEYDPTGCIL